MCTNLPRTRLLQLPGMLPLTSSTHQERLRGMARRGLRSRSCPLGEREFERSFVRSICSCEKRKQRFDQSAAQLVASSFSLAGTLHAAAHVLCARHRVAHNKKYALNGRRLQPPCARLLRCLQVPARCSGTGNMVLATGFKTLLVLLRSCSSLPYMNQPRLFSICTCTMPIDTQGRPDMRLSPRCLVVCRRVAMQDDLRISCNFPAKA